MTDELASDPGGPGLDRMTLTGLSGHGYHGVLAEERATGQTFSVDVTLHLDTTAAAAGDDLTRTVNYAEVATETLEVLTGPPFDLIESLAAAIAQRALSHDRVQAVDVTVHKPQAPIPVPFTDVTITIRRPAGRDDAPPTRPHRADTGAATRHGGEAGGSGLVRRDVVVALGANLGDRRATLHSAVTELDLHPRVRVAGVSPLLRSAAVTEPGGEDQPDYLNAVIVLDTDLPLRELLALCQGIELGHGRRRTERWGPRTLDLDLIASGDLRWDEPDLVLPHPRAHERTFVLTPWVRLDPAAALPGHGPISALPAGQGATVEWVADRWWSREDTR